VRLERLKDKLGNRSNASSEAEFCEASGWLVGKRAMACVKSSKWAA
jgi:putative acyl-CoA dehydrogenase